MTKACSIEAGRLSPDDKERYAATRNNIHAQRAAVDVMLKNAKQEHVQLIAAVQEQYPGLITSDGRFEEDILADRYAQEELDFEKSRKEEKARSAKPSSAKVPAGKQPGSTGKAAKGDTLKRKPTTTAKSAGQQATNPKEKVPEKSKPAGPVEPEPAIREKQQPDSVVFEATNEWQPFPEGAIAPGGAEFRLSLTDETQREIRLLPTVAPEPVIREKQQPTNLTAEELEDEVYTVLYDGLFNDATKAERKTAQTQLSEASGSVLWGENKALTLRTFVDVAQAIGIDKASTFSKYRRVWDFAMQHGLVPEVYLYLKRMGKAPTRPSEEMKKILDDAGVARVDSAAEVKKTVTNKLATLLTDILSDETLGIAHPERSQVKTNREIKEWAKTADLGFEVRGRPLSAWLDKNNQLVWEDGFLVSTKGKHVTRSTTSSGTAVDDEIVSDFAVLQDANIHSRTKIFDHTGAPVTKPISLGVAKLLITRFRSRMNRNANIRFMSFKSVEELKAKRPDIYAAAKAAHEGKRAIPKQAAGLAYDRTVLIFSDNIATKRQLAFTLAHEVIGHFGLGSIMPKADFQNLMDMVYNADADIRREVDAQETKGVNSRYEAIEEALADRAAEINNSLVQRIAAMIKRFLNRLGFHFDDDMTQYFVYHSRRYARTGSVGDVSASALYHNLDALNQRSINARASNIGSTILDAAQGKIRMSGTRKFVENVTHSLGRMATREGAVLNAKGTWAGLKRGMEHVQTLTNKALHSTVLRDILNIMKEQAAEVAARKTKYSDLTEFTLRIEGKLLTKLGLMKEGGPSQEQLERADRIVELWLRGKNTRTEAELIAEIKTSPALVEQDSNGDYRISKKGWDHIRERGAMSRAQLEKGIKVPLLDAKTGEPTGEFETIPLGFKIGDAEWRIANEIRDAIDQAAFDVHFNMLRGIQKNHAYMRTKLRRKYKSLTDAQMEILDDVVTVYAKIYNKKSSTQGKGIKWNTRQTKAADAFLYNVTRVLDSKAGRIKLNDWKNGFLTGRVDKNGNPAKPSKNDRLTEALLVSGDPDIDAIIKRLPDLHKDGTFPKESVSKIKHALANIHALSNDAINSELYAKHTIMTAYIPLVRRGRWQLRIRALDKDGNEIRLADSLQSELMYSRTDDDTGALEQAKSFNEEIKKAEGVSVLDFNGDLLEGVTFEAVVESALESPPLAGGVSYGEILHTLARAGVDLDALDRAKLVKLSAAQHSTARSNLKRDFVPGWDPDIRKGVWEHLERQANIAGKNLFQHEIDNVLTDDTHQGEGDLKTLLELQRAWKKARGTKDEFRARREMDDYQHRYIKAAPLTEVIPTVDSRTGKEDTTNGEGLAAHYLSQASDMVRNYKGTHGLPSVTGDEMLGDLSSLVLTGTAAAQLGGSIAAAMVNTTSLATHTTSYLATYNHNTGYGGGHGMQAAVAAVIKAGRDLSLFTDGPFKDAVGSAKELDAVLEMSDAERMRKYGLTKEQTQMLYDLTVQGELTPNLNNHFTGVTQFGKSGNRITKGLQVWMFMFAKTEQYNRRVTALASYRLDREKGMSHEEAVGRAKQAVDYSQGNYDSYNYPTLVKGPILKYMYIYKQFQVITVEIMRQLDRNERIAFVGMLVLMTGLKGVPFMEDGEDIIDTLMEKFGVKWIGVEAYIATLANAMGVPSGLLLRGPFDYLFDFAGTARIGHGDLIPGTGLLKAGMSLERELSSIAGPAVSAWGGIFSSAGMVGKYALETIGLREDATTVGDILRTGGGSSALKNIGKGITYLVDGEIRNDRGQLVAKNTGVMEAVLQMIGFYPASAATQYDVNRLSNYARDVGKQYSAEVVSAYNKATPAGQARIRRDTAGVNRDVGKDSPFYISDLVTKARKKLKSDNETSSERNLKALPKNMKRMGQHMMEIRGLDKHGMPK